jgi:hypothetical protein
LSAPVLSRLLGVRGRESRGGPGRAAGQANPPGGAGPSRSGSRHPETHPILRASPFPEVTDLICRLPLPTFFYRLEAAHLGDLMRLSVRPSVRINLSVGFSRAIESAPDTQEAGCSAVTAALSPGNQIPGPAAQSSTRKESSCRGSHWRLRLPSCRHTISTSRFRNMNLIPFRVPQARTCLLRSIEAHPQDRLTRVQVLFTRNLSPLQSSKFPFEYLLLPPRSALGATRPGLAPRASQ